MQILDGPRFGDVVVEVGLIDSPDGVLQAGLSSDQDFADRPGGLVLVEFDEVIDAPLAGEQMVTEHQPNPVFSGLQLRHHGAGICHVFGQLDREMAPEVLQVAGDSFPNLRLVLNHQYHDAIHG